MAENSIRERIINNIDGALSDISSIQTVARKKLGFSDLSGIAGSQLPYVSVIAGLPVPDEVKWSGRTQGKIDKIRSKLTVQLTVYGLENVTPDSELSNLSDDIISKLYEDYTRDGLALSTVVKPELEVGIFDPYFAFNIGIDVMYVHDTSSI